MSACQFRSLSSPGHMGRLHRRLRLTCSEIHLAASRERSWSPAGSLCLPCRIRSRPLFWRRNLPSPDALNGFVCVYGDYVSTVQLHVFKQPSALYNTSHSTTMTSGIRRTDRLSNAVQERRSQVRPPIRAAVET